MADLRRHIAYHHSPVLFMKENWTAFNAFNKMKCEKIKPFDYQLDFIENIHEHKASIIVKSRQMHVSSMIELYIAWYMLFNTDKVIGILASSLESGKNILDKIKIILQNYSVDGTENGVLKTYYHWEDDFVKNNKTELSLKNGCRIKVFTPSTDAGRGETLNLLYVDEAAFIKDFEYIWMGVGMALSSIKDSKVIIASTPKEDSTFNNMFLLAENQESNFNPIRLHWSIHPEYSKEIKEIVSPFYQYSSPWFEEACKRYGYNSRVILQELECLVKYKDQSNKSKTISLRLSPELYKKLETRLSDGSVSDYIRALIEKDLDSYV